MRKNTTLTIVIPAYNEAAILRSCLDAIQNQTVRPDEVIVVNNNSSDDTVDIAKSYPFVRVLHEKQQGISHAHKKGFDNTKSEFIARIDADSLLSSDWVARVKKILQQL